VPREVYKASSKNHIKERTHSNDHHYMHGKEPRQHVPMPTFANAPPTLLPRDQLLEVKMEIATATLVGATGDVLVMVVVLV